MINQNEVYQELITNSIEYAYAVNTDRALPDARTGLIPVRRRILWSCYESQYFHNKPHKKCARIVGDTMGKYHPHGDSSIYGALVNMAQDWKMRYPLIDFHGNVGNIAGDDAGSMRYTEARLAKITEKFMMQGIDKNSVTFLPNFDETEQEPETLPSVFPNLLCNPNSGIGWAMACSWAPHNLTEVVIAILDYLDDKEPMLLGPDFPTGGIIINKDDIPKIMKTGRGSVKIRARYKIEKNSLVFYEIPYENTVEKIIDQIGDLCNKKEIEGIEEVRDETDLKGVRIVIELERGVNPDAVAQKLYMKTRLQDSFSYNQVALVGKTPKLLNLKDAIKIYVEHNLNCILKIAEFDLAKSKDRKEVVDGLLKAIASIDDIIAIIRASKDKDEATIVLQSKYKFTDRQIKAILAMRLSSLTKLDGVKLQKEQAELIDTINYLIDVVEKEETRKNVLRESLNELKNNFGDARRTELAQIEIPKTKVEKEKAEVIPEDVVVIVTEAGDVKRVPKSSFRVQNRNSKGIKTENDVIMTTISTNTVDALMAFTDKGRMYRILVDKLPVGTNTSKGQRLGQLLNINPDEKIITVTSLYDNTKAEYVVFFTKKGLIKKTKLSEYTTTKRAGGTQAIKLKDDDSIANVTFMNEEQIIIITKNGKGIRFESKGIVPIGRVTSGVKAISLDEDDEVLCGRPVHKETDYIGLFTAAGTGKQIALNELPIQNKGGKGVYVYKNHKVVGATMLDDKDSVLIIGKPSSLCIAATDIPKLGRIAIVGNILIKNSEIKSILKL